MRNGIHAAKDPPPFSLTNVTGWGFLLWLACAFVFSNNLPGADLTGESSATPTVVFTLDYDTSVDPRLQEALKRIDQDLRTKHGMTTEETAVGLLDLKTDRVAMIHPDRMEYAASLPKLGILLAYFALRPEEALAPNPEIRHALGLMAKASTNPEATRFSRKLGLKEIQQVLNDHGFWDETRGGGLWMGKHFAADDERIGDPLKNFSHGATVRQLLRFFLLIDQRRLVSPEASEAMIAILDSPDIPHNDFKFVKGLEGRDVRVLRKWGGWRNWRHDSALVEGGERRYILAALTHHPNGNDYLADLASEVERLMER